jgi:putative membrane-bound dehydrogenase-like protein
MLSSYLRLAFILGLLPIFSCQSGSAPVPPGFEIHPDFKLELVAVEPLVFDPVDMEFDENGDAYVLEMPGYPLEDEQSRLILLEDENGDGSFDKRTVFADGLNLASSFLPYRGGFLVAAPPHLLFIKDTDGDQQADQRDILMDGFSEGNLQHNYNGLTYGLDDWIYCANGGNSGAPFFVSQPEQKMDIRNDDFRFNLAASKMERIGRSSGGFELAVDHWGRIFETHNLYHVSHLVFESRYIAGIPVSARHSLSKIYDHEENLLSRLYPIGEQETRVNHPEQSGYFSGSCGITFYGGGAFPEGFNDNLFVADVVLNLVHLDVLSPDGSSFKTSRKRDQVEFLASTDRSFRPVNMTTGPDGALYLMDMYREVIEHPEWIPDDMEAKMDLNAGKDKGRIYRIVPRKNWQAPAALAFEAADEASLVQALTNPNQWTRLTAHRLLMEKANESSVPLLEKMLAENNHPYAQLHGLWILDGLGNLNDDALLKGLHHPHGGVRENALKMAEKRFHQNPALAQTALELTRDPNDRVSMQAWLSLSTLDEKQFAVHQPAMAEALVQRLSSRKTDQWAQMAMSSSFASAPVSLVQLLLTDPRVQFNAGAQEINQTMARLIGQEQNMDQSEELLVLLQSRAPSIQISLIEALAEGWTRTSRTVLGSKGLAALRQMESSQQAPVALFKATAKLREDLGLPVSSRISAMIAHAREGVFSPSESTAERLSQLQLIGLDEFENRAGILYRMLDNREPLDLQREALQQLWQANDPSIGPELLKLWPDLGPEARKYTGNILLYKSSNHGLLLSAIETGKINLGELNLDLERRRVLLWAEDEAIKQRAEALFSDSGVVQRKEALASMRPALELNGNIQAGERHFVSLCISCHQYGELGVDVGPVLTEINRKSKESLLHDMLDPNAAADTRYLNHQVKTTNGTIYSGIIAEESDTEVVIKMIGGEEKTIAKADIDKLSSMGLSMMPEGLEKGLSTQDMADLLAFLQQSP